MWGTGKELASGFQEDNAGAKSQMSSENETESTANKMVKFKTDDKHEFIVEYKVARKLGAFVDFALFATQMESIQISSISSHAFGKIIQWAENHNYDKITPEKDNYDQRMNDNDINQWKIEFFKLEPDKLLELVDATTLFDMEDLKNEARKAAKRLGIDI